MNNTNSQENSINWGTSEDTSDEAAERVSYRPVATLKDPSVERTNSNETGNPSIIGFTGAKGGVGTTTVALNVAMTLVQLGQKVIYVEMSHHFGSAAWHLGMPETTPLEIRSSNPKDVDANLINNMLMIHSTGLKVACLSPWADEGHYIPPEVLNAFLRELGTQGHTIILDFPLERSNPAAFFLQQCQLINLVTEIDPMGMAATKMQLQWVRSQSQSPVLLTGVNRTNIPPTKSLEHIQEEMGCETFTMIPAASELCCTANTQHEPLVCIRPKSVPALQLITLRDQILRHLNGEDSPSNRDRRGKGRRTQDRRRPQDGW